MKIDITILLPVKNDFKHLQQAINSILVQTFTNFELLVLDSSTYISPYLIKNYYDNRIRYFYLKDHNIPRALNFGIINSKSDIIARIDADDFAVENKIEIQFKYLTENKSVDIVGTNFYYYTNNNRIFGEGILPEHHKDIEFLMPVISTIAHPTVMMRKNALSNVGMYNPDLDFSEDLELFLRLLRINTIHIIYKYHYIIIESN